MSNSGPVVARYGHRFLMAMFTEMRFRHKQIWRIPGMSACTRKFPMHQNETLQQWLLKVSLVIFGPKLQVSTVGNLIGLKKLNWLVNGHHKTIDDNRVLVDTGYNDLMITSLLCQNDTVASFSMTLLLCQGSPELPVHLLHQYIYSHGMK